MQYENDDAERNRKEMERNDMKGWLVEKNLDCSIALKASGWWAWRWFLVAAASNIIWLVSS